MPSLALSTIAARHATISVAKHWSDGTLTQLGGDYNFAFAPTGVATLAAGTVTALAAGSTVLTVTKDGLSATVDVTVTADVPPPVADGLVVTLGTPGP